MSFYKWFTFSFHNLMSDLAASVRCVLALKLPLFLHSAIVLHFSKPLIMQSAKFCSRESACNFP